MKDYNMFLESFGNNGTVIFKNKLSTESNFISTFIDENKGKIFYLDEDKMELIEINNISIKSILKLNNNIYLIPNDKMDKANDYLNNVKDLVFSIREAIKLRELQEKGYIQSFENLMKKYLEQ